LRREAKEQLGVSVWAFSAADDERIATCFAFAADPRGEEPHGGVEEQQRLDDALDEIHQIVPAADVGQLVQQDHFDFVGSPASEGGGREQDDGPNDPDEHGRGDAIADGDGDAPADAKRRG
jgi:hypothetical protein